LEAIKVIEKVGTGDLAGIERGLGGYPFPDALGVQVLNALMSKWVIFRKFADAFAVHNGKTEADDVCAPTPARSLTITEGRVMRLKIKANALCLIERGERGRETVISWRWRPSPSIYRCDFFIREETHNEPK
jgi:hypothetical protein